MTPEKLMFHIYTSISGEYWEKIKNLKNISVEVNFIPVASEIRGKRMKFVQHQADYIKLSMLYKYGGTALDFDVIMINGERWKDLQRRSECVLVEEDGLINGGLYSCIQHSPFVAKWLDGYHTDYKPDEWVFNASKKPLYLLQSNACYNIHVDRTVCGDPSYWDHGRWFKSSGVKNWKAKTAIHYYRKKMPHDGENLLEQKHSLAKGIKYVYNA